MSGPKRSTWRIRQERWERLRREREKRRAAQVTEITDRLDQARKRLAGIGDSAVVLEWIQEAEEALDDDLREAWRGLRGIERYLDHAEERQRQARLRQERRRREEEEARRLEARRQAKIQRLQEELDALAEEARPVLTPGIEQRLKLFSTALRTNPDNADTLKQLADFKRQLGQFLDEHEEKQQRLALMREALVGALNGRAETGADGAFSVSGTIGGVSIRARIGSGSEIHFDTPADGSCRQAMKDLQERLGEQGVELGPIRVLNTGQTIGQRQTAPGKKRIDA